MTYEEKVEWLATRLLAVTRDGKWSWVKTSDSTAFRTEVGDYTIMVCFDGSLGIDGYGDHFSERAGQRGIELFLAVRRRVLNVSGAIDRILKELEKC